MVERIAARAWSVGLVVSKSAIPAPFGIADCDYVGWGEQVEGDSLASDVRDDGAEAFGLQAELRESVSGAPAGEEGAALFLRGGVGDCG